MVALRDGSHSPPQSPASATSTATFDPRDHEGQQQTWEVELPEFDPQRNYEAIADCLTEWAFENRFSFVKERSWCNRAGNTYKVKLMCDRACKGGKRQPHRVDEALTRRSSSSKSAPACPFRITVSALKATAGQWVVVPNQQCLRHEGHPPSAQPQEHLHFRKHYTTDEAREYIETLLRDNTVRIRHAYTRIIEEYPDTQLRLSDLYNWRARIRRTGRRGYSDTQRFIARLKQSEHVSFYCIRWQGDIEDDVGHGDPDVDPGTLAGTLALAEDPPQIRRPLRILWILRKQAKQWKRFPWTVSIDATYRTNYKEMPLVIAVAQTPEKVVMPLFQAVLDNETTNSYNWLLEAVMKAQTSLEIPSPEVVITDGDQELITAISRVWPSTQRQRCIFHLSNNVILNIKKLWKRPVAIPMLLDDEEDDIDDFPPSPDDEDDFSLLAGMLGVGDRPANDIRFAQVPDEVANTRAGLFLLWQFMLYASSTEVYNQAWDLLQKQFKKSQRHTVAYIENNLIPIREEWAGCWTKSYRNFGSRTTSPNESSNASVKSYGLSSRVQFEELFLTVETYVDDRYTRFYEGVARSATRVQMAYLNQPWLGDCPYRISYTALDLLDQQHRRFLGTLPNTLHHEGQPLARCTGQTAAQYGLVCAHEMARRHEAKQEALVCTTDIHTYWHLTKKRFNDAIMAIRSPPKAVPKGRPRRVGGPFGNEEALLQAPGPRAGSQTGIPAGGRRAYSSWELSGPGLDVLDAIDSIGSPEGMSGSQLTESTVPGIELGTPLRSSSAAMPDVGIVAWPAMELPADGAPAIEAPMTARKRAGTDSLRRGGALTRPRLS